MVTQQKYLLKKKNPKSHQIHEFPNSQNVEIKQKAIDLNMFE